MIGLGNLVLKILTNERKVPLFCWPIRRNIKISLADVEFPLTQSEPILSEKSGKFTFLLKYKKVSETNHVVFCLTTVCLHSTAFSNLREGPFMILFKRLLRAEQLSEIRYCTAKTDVAQALVTKKISCTALR